jgi:hypothetical protein
MGENSNQKNKKAMIERRECAQCGKAFVPKGGKILCSYECFVERRRSPQYRAKLSRGVKKSLRNPAVRARRKAAALRIWKDPAVRARASRAHKRQWRDPAFRARHAKSWTPALRKRHSKVLTKTHANPAVRKKIATPVGPISLKLWKTAKYRRAVARGWRRRRSERNA